MSEESEEALRKLKFGTEVSTWYHEYRRGMFSAAVTVVRLISLVGSVAALLAVSSWVESVSEMVLYVAILSVVVGVVNLLDLVFGFDAKAREHTSLYQRFKALQSEIARGQRDYEEHLPQWEAEAQAIRIDEPPTYWALWNIVMNQVLEKYGVADGYQRQITPYQRLLKHLMRFNPQSFPLKDAVRPEPASPSI